MRKRRKRNKLTVLAAVLLILVGLGTAAFYGWQIYSTEQEYKEGDDAYDLISQLATADPDKENVEPGEIPAPPIQEENLQELEENNVPIIDLEAVQDINEEIACWLYSPDTVIDYPVCQGEDNEYYLYHLADGTYNRNGCLFVDYRNAFDFSDPNTLIYGHHMASGSMFASLINYADQSYYDLHPVMYLTVNGRMYRMEIFSGYTTSMDSSAYELNFSTDHELAEWLREISAKSDFRPRAITLSTDDRIVTLSTCAYSFQDARYKSITFEDYSEEELLEIFRLFCSSNDMVLSESAEQALKAYLAQLCLEKPENFANGREMRNLFETALSNQANRLAELTSITDDELNEITTEDLAI